MADPTLPTFDSLYLVYQSEVLDRDARLTDWNEGSALDALAGGGAALAGEVCLVGVDLFKAVFLDSCEGDEIDAWAADHWGDAIERKEATAAVGTIAFLRDTDEGLTTIPAGTTISGTVDGVTVEVTTNGLGQIPDGEQFAYLSATCTVTGPAGNVAAAVLTTLQGSFDGSDALTVSNTSRFTGGADAESDEAFKARIRAFPQALRRGTAGALELGALAVGGVSFATVSEAYIAPEDGGYVAVYVGDPDARANDDLVALVVTELRNWRAAGVWVQVFAAAREEMALALAVSIPAGADQAAVSAAVSAAVLAYTDQLAPGETLYLSQVLAAGVKSHPDVIDVALPELEADVEPAAPQNALRVPSSSLLVSLVEVG
jgi:uncharacterized phage protein gp47/JayE